MRLIILVLSFASILPYIGECAVYKGVLTNLTRTVLIAHVSDTHINRGTNQFLYRANLEKVIKQVNDANVDIVVITGDLTEDGKPQEYSDFKQIIKGFKKPVFVVPGNHDIGNKKLNGKKNEINFTRLVNYHLNIGDSWFVKEMFGLKLIFANSSLFGSGMAKEKAMWKFLEKNMSSPSKTPILFFLHHPPFQYKPEEKGGEYWNLEPAPRFRLFGLFQQSGVAAVFSGHLHKPLTNMYNNVLYYTTHPVAFGLPKGKQKAGWTLLTISSNGIQITPKFIEVPSAVVDSSAKTTR